MPYKAQNQKITYFHNKIKNPLELRLGAVPVLFRCVPFCFIYVPGAQAPGPGPLLHPAPSPLLTPTPHPTQAAALGPGPGNINGTEMKQK